MMVKRSSFERRLPKENLIRFEYRNKDIYHMNFIMKAQLDIKGKTIVGNEHI